MNPFQEFFSYTRRFVTKKDIRDFCDLDPSYECYVAAWTRTLRTGFVPDSPEFNYREVIELTGYEEIRDSVRFLRFSLFSLSVAFRFLEFGADSDSVLASSYLSYRVIVDSYALGDHKLIYLVDMVLRKTADVLKMRLGFYWPSGSFWLKEPDFPFFLLGAFVLNAWEGNWDAVRLLARRIIWEDRMVRRAGKVRDRRFLLGLTVYDLWHGKWMRLLEELPVLGGDEKVGYVIDAIVQGRSVV